MRVFSGLNHILLSLAVVFLSNGCTSAPSITPPSIAGTFSGVNADAKPIVLIITEQDGGFMGRGTVDGNPLAISGTKTWVATGTAAYDNGTFVAIRIALSADSQNLTLETPGQPTVTLARGEPAVNVPAGPFSGQYDSPNTNITFTQLSIIQHGSLITGVGLILGQTAGIAGWQTEPQKAKGILSFPDQSQASFSAELSSDKKSITVRGLGAPITLQKK